MYSRIGEKLSGSISKIQTQYLHLSSESWTVILQDGITVQVYDLEEIDRCNALYSREETLKNESENSCVVIVMLGVYGSKIGKFPSLKACTFFLKNNLAYIMFMATIIYIYIYYAISISRFFF